MNFLIEVSLHSHRDLFATEQIQCVSCGLGDSSEDKYELTGLIDVQSGKFRIGLTKKKINH